MFIAQTKSNPASLAIQVNGTLVNLSRIDALKVCRGIHAGLTTNTAFTVSVAAESLTDLDEMMMIVKYAF